MKTVTVLRADCLPISGPHDRRVYIHIGGEYAGRRPAQIRIVPDALTLLTPPEYGG
jgi:diacylglycerol kinase family enzyme